MPNPTKMVYLITSGDLRLAANQACWPAQAELERKLTACLAHRGVELRRAAPVDPIAGHGFISSQRQGDGTLDQKWQEPLEAVVYNAGKYPS